MIAFERIRGRSQFSSKNERKSPLETELKIDTHFKAQEKPNDAKLCEQVGFIPFLCMDILQADNSRLIGLL